MDRSAARVHQRSEAVRIVGHRSKLYYEAVPETAQNLRYMRLIDEQYL